MSARKTVRDLHETVEFSLGHNLAGSTAVTVRTASGAVSWWLSPLRARKLGRLLLREADATEAAAAKHIEQLNAAAARQHAREGSR